MNVSVSLGVRSESPFHSGKQNRNQGSQLRLQAGCLLDLHLPYPGIVLCGPRECGSQGRAGQALWPADQHPSLGWLGAP
jgi:hypothetical protein